MTSTTRSRGTVRAGDDAAEYMELLRRHRNESNLSYAYRTLEYNILMLKIPPRTLVQESRIAERLKMSKSPVHQAVALLRDHYLMDVKARSATHVSPINLDAVAQGCFLRSTIEPAVLDELVSSISQQSLELLKSNLDAQCKELAGDVDPYRYIHLDDRFHQIIYEADGKSMIWDIMKKVATNFDRIRYMAFVLGYESPSDKEHIRIYEILSGSSQASPEEMHDFVKGHMHHYETYLASMIHDYPDYFEIK